MTIYIDSNDYTIDYIQSQMTIYNWLYTIDYIHSQMNIQLTIYSQIKWLYTIDYIQVKWLYIHSQMTIYKCQVYTIDYIH